MLGVWSGLLDEFMDRSAVHRFQHYAANHAGYRWKPKLALVLPKRFSLGRPTHRRDLSVALEVLASIMDQYNIEVVSDSPDSARLFHNVVPFSHEAISASTGALVLLSRKLNDEISTIRPSRYVAADPCVYRMNEQRIVFAAGGVELAFAPASEDEIAQIARGCVSVLLNEDEDVPSFVEALRRLLGRGLTMSLTLSSRTDEVFSRQIHAALNGDSRPVIHDSEPCRFAAQSEFQISNDLVALSTQKKSPLPRYLFGQGTFWRVGAEPLRRSDFYLLRGEEATAHGLLRTWLGPRQFDESRSATAHPADVVEPLISIVVPASDQATEIIRLAHSIYQQDYSWIEVIFVSHGSPPETLEAIRISENQLMKRRFRIRVIELARAFGSATIPGDIGIRASSGDMICILDPDDWLERGFFAFLRGALGEATHSFVRERSTTTKMVRPRMASSSMAQTQTCGMSNLLSRLGFSSARAALEACRGSVSPEICSTKPGETTIDRATAKPHMSGGGPLWLASESSCIMDG